MSEFEKVIEERLISIYTKLIFSSKLPLNSGAKSLGMEPDVFEKKVYIEKDRQDKEAKQEKLIKEIVLEKIVGLVLSEDLKDIHDAVDGILVTALKNSINE